MKGSRKVSDSAVGLAACLFELKPDSGEVQLLPAGRFHALDGRPADVPDRNWYIDAALAQRLIAAAQARTNPFAIDYEHQTLAAEKNGQPAPAAGWWRNASMVWREGLGLFATGVQWTEKARAMIAAGEYKFFSPVFKYDKQTGAVTEILMGAVTNYPALDGMEALAARAAARFDSDQPDRNKPDQESEPMKALLKLFGLKDDATETEVIAAATAMKAKNDELMAKNQELGQAVATAKAQIPDPAKYVSIDAHTKLAGDFAALKGDLEARDLGATIQTAINEGRLAVAEEQWARDFAKSHGFAALKASLEKRPVIAALKRTQTGGLPPAGNAAGEMDETALAVCRQLGVEPEAYKKTLAA